MTTARILLTTLVCLLLPGTTAWAVGTPRTIAIPTETPRLDGDRSHEVKRPVNRDGQSSGELVVPRMSFEPEDESPRRSTSANRIDPLYGTRHIASGDDTLGTPPDPPTGNLVSPGSIPDPIRGSITDPDQGSASSIIRNPSDGLSPDKSKDGSRARAASADDPPWNSTVLFYAIVTTCLCAACMYSFYLAYEYRQRWIEALTAQNNRLSQSFDALTEGMVTDLYLPDTFSAGSVPDSGYGISDASYGGVRFGELTEYP